MATWHPRAKRVPHSDAGPFEQGFTPRLVWHTTEGHGLPNYSGSAPHFTIHPRTGELWQHIPCNRAAKALKGKGSAGIATNGAHAIQVEVIGFAGESDNWPDSYYERLRDLADWIERECNVASTESVDFQSRWHGMSKEKWRSYKGHCGHQHVPGNDHWDPGEFKIEKVLGNGNSNPHRNLTLGDTGPDVSALQRAINKRADGCCRPDRRVEVDGEYGKATEDNAAFVGYILGIGESQDEIVSGGLSEQAQRWIRWPSGRNDTQLERAGTRREKHCHCTHDH